MLFSYSKQDSKSQPRPDSLFHTFILPGWVVTHSCSLSSENQEAVVIWHPRNTATRFRSVCIQADHQHTPREVALGSEVSGYFRA